MDSKPSSWLKEVKKRSGMQTMEKNSDEILNAFRPNDQHEKSVKMELANKINNTFLAPLSQFTPLSPDCYSE